MPEQHVVAGVPRSVAEKSSPHRACPAHPVGSAITAPAPMARQCEEQTASKGAALAVPGAQRKATRGSRLLFPDRPSDEDSALVTSADQRSAQFDSSDGSGQLWRGLRTSLVLSAEVSSPRRRTSRPAGQRAAIFSRQGFFCLALPEKPSTSPKRPKKLDRKDRPDYHWLKARRLPLDAHIPSVLRHTASSGTPLLC